MRRFLVQLSEPEASNHTPSLADFTITTPELEFSVHTGIESDVFGVLAKQPGADAVERARPAQRLVHDAGFVAEDLACDPFDALRGSVNC